MAFKLFLKLSIVLLLDVILIGYWVYSIDPSPGMGMGLIIMMPFLFILNLLLAFLFFLLFEYIIKQKDNHYPSILAVNAVVSPLILFLFFGYATERHVSDPLTHENISKSFPFSLSGKKYMLEFAVADGKFVDNNRFNIYEVMPEGGEAGVMIGKYYQLKDSVFLVNDTSLHGYLAPLSYDSFKMKVTDHKLIGFPLHTAEIKLEK